MEPARLLAARHTEQGEDCRRRGAAPSRVGRALFSHIAAIHFDSVYPGIYRSEEQRPVPQRAARLLELIIQTDRRPYR
jgi:hypothetical protein